MEFDFQFILNEHQQKQWSDFWAGCRHCHPRQHLQFAEVERSNGRVPIYITGMVEGKVVCLAVFSIHPLLPGNKGSFEAICLRGPAFDDVKYVKEFLEQTIQRLKQLQVGLIRISPFWSFDEAEPVLTLLKDICFIPYSPLGSRQPTGWVDLKREDEEILASFSKSTRYQIRLAERGNVSIGPAENMDEAMFAFRSLEKMRSKRGIISMPYKEFKACFEHVMKDGEFGVLLNSYIDNTFLGGLWIYRSARVAHTSCYTIEPSNAVKVHSNFSIGPSLWWEGIKWAKVGSSPADPRHFVWQFKEKFKPEPIDILAQHIYKCNTGVYTAYNFYNFLLRVFRFARSLPHQIKIRLNSRKTGGKND